MTTIYILTNGMSYSDYSILGVYTTKEKATIAHSHVGGDIEEWDADVLPYHKGKRYWSVVVRVDGTSNAYPNLPSPDHKPTLYSNTTYHDFCWARTPEEAIKIASERRSRAIVNRDLGVE